MNAIQSKGAISKTEEARREYGVGRVCEAQRQPGLALAHFSKAVVLVPEESEYIYRLAGALRETGRFVEALGAYQRALSLRPKFVEALLDLAGTLRLLGQDKHSIPLYRQAVALRPDFAIAQNNLGNVLLDVSDFDGAIASLKRAADLGLSVAQGNLGSAYLEVGRIDEAIACFRRALAHDLHDFCTHSSLVFALQFHPDSDNMACLREARIWNRNHAFPQTQRSFSSRKKDARRRLRVGYLSPDFRDHCQALFMLPLLEHHDPREVEIFCYSSTLQADDTTERMRRLVHKWRDVGMIDDQGVAELVTADEIDILVDLTMHMARGRLRLFAKRVAPVQMCWLAYPGTTGLDCMDYRLSDPHLDPPNSDLSAYSEFTHRLAETFWCYHPLTSEPAPGAPPRELNGYVTFGCLNAFRKVNDGVVHTFAAVLREVTDSRLTLLCPSGESRARVLHAFRKLGIDARRIQFVERMPRPEYLRCYQGIDVCLDTFPYNGHTTSLDALWMGVPVVTLVGRTIVGRAGLSQATHLQLTELVANSCEEYVSIAVKLAGDDEGLARLRSSLRKRMEKSPLMDAARFAREIEAAYRSCWTRFCLEHEDAP